MLRVYILVLTALPNVVLSDSTLLCGGDVLLGNTENHTVYQLLHESLIVRPPSAAKGSAFWSYILPKSRSINVGPVDPYFSTGGSDELILHNVTRRFNGTRIRHDLYTDLGRFEPPQFVDLIIGKLPHFLLSSSNVVYVVENSKTPVVVRFAVDGVPAPAVELRRGDETTATNDGIQFVVNTSSLLLNNLNSSHTGIYHLVGVNCLGESRIAIEIRVRVPARIMSSVTDVSARCGDRVQLQCSALGYPAPNVTWHYHPTRDHDVSSSVGELNRSTHLVSVQSNLTFDEVTLSDGESTYVCVASNGIGGNVTEKFRLNISCSPSECYLRVYEITNVSMRANIESPRLDGGSPIEEYNVTVLDDGDKRIVHTNVTNEMSVNITSLTPHKHYKLLCRARNKIGYGNTGFVTNMTQDKPGPVVITTPVKADCTSASIDFRLLSDGGSPLEEYIIERSGSGAQTKLPSSKDSYAFSQLEEDTRYTVTVRAKNKYGLGEVSNPVEFTTVDCGQSGLLTIILSVVASVAALAVLAIALIVTGKVRKKRKGHRKRSMEVKSRSVLVKKWKRQISSSGADFVVDRSRLTLNQPIGEGAFGSVFKGTVTGIKERGATVAVKACKVLSGSQEVEELLSECSMMLAFHHPNVLHLIGVCLNYDPENYGPLIIVPFMHHGDVKQYLTRRRLEAGDYADLKLTPIEGITLPFLIRFGLQIASGMEYLVGKKVVHRDLAARNCMLNERLIVKVADFGLSRSLSDSDYYTLQSSKKLPVKWLAPECMSDRKFTHASDVWAYGVALWEIFGLGVEPYPGVQNYEIPKLLRMGVRLDRPRDCPDVIFALMKSCWQRDVHSRPSFSHLHSQLEEIAMGLVGYQDFTAEAEEEEDSNSSQDNASTYEIGGRSETIL